MNGACNRGGPPGKANPASKSTRPEPNATLRDAQPRHPPVSPAEFKVPDQKTLTANQDGKAFAKTCHRGQTVAVGQINLDARQAVAIHASSDAQLTLSLHKTLGPADGDVKCVVGMNAKQEIQPLEKGPLYFVVSGTGQIKVMVKSTPPEKKLALAPQCDETFKISQSTSVELHGRLLTKDNPESTRICASQSFGRLIACIETARPGAISLRGLSDLTGVHIGLSGTKRHQRPICAPSLNPSLQHSIAADTYTVSFEANSRQVPEIVRAKIRFEATEESP